MSDIRVGILGGGAMGQVLARMTEEKDGFRLAGVVEPLSGGRPEDLEAPDLLIDFSNPANLEMLADFCRDRACPAVIATTGYGPEQIEKIESLSGEVPVVFSANYSLGVNVMKRVLMEITPILKDAFDMEIVEAHHNKKLDAPSGTAKMLLEAMDGDGRYEHVFGRCGNRRRGREIGVHALRGGTVAGTHTVLFAGEDEILELTHKAGSRKIFGAGALKAAAFAAARAAEGRTGLYTMEQVLFG